jgi:hypothetical protein
MEIEMSNRKKSFVALLLLAVLVVPLTADQRPSFVFGGKQFYVGMSMSEAVRLLSACCRLSPPIDASTEKLPLTASGGHFIWKEDGTETSILGGIFFADQKVTRLTKPIADDVDFSNEDLVAFTRALKRVLHNDAGEFERTAKISVQHEKANNAEADLISITFPDGRGIELHVGTLDKPNALTGKRDFVTADETLGSGQ